MRTYSRATFEEAMAAWDAGDFSDEWKPYRHQAAMRGILYPPTGTKWDGWDDDEPSQRAMLIRAIRETPQALRRAIDRSRSWSEVVALLLRERDDARADAREEERRMRDEPDHLESAMALKAIVERIAQS